MLTVLRDAARPRLATTATRLRTWCIPVGVIPCRHHTVNRTREVIARNRACARTTGKCAWHTIRVYFNYLLLCFGTSDIVSECINALQSALACVGPLRGKHAVNWALLVHVAGLLLPLVHVIRLCTLLAVIQWVHYDGTRACLHTTANDATTSTISTIARGRARRATAVGAP